MAQVRHRGFSNLHRKAGKKQPQILHFVQDDKHSTQRDLNCDCPDYSFLFLCDHPQIAVMMG
jgi:hypothetical protein